MPIFGVIGVVWVAAAAAALALCRVGRSDRPPISEESERPNEQAVESLRLVRDDDALGEMERRAGLIPS